MQNEKYELPDGSYSVSEIQDNFQYVIKKLQKVTDNLPVRRYVNQIENRITFRIKTGSYLKLLMTETIKLLGSTKSKITTNENGENIPRLEINEVVVSKRLPQNSLEILESGTEKQDLRGKYLKKYIYLQKTKIENY